MLSLAMPRFESVFLTLFSVVISFLTVSPVHDGAAVLLAEHRPQPDLHPRERLSDDPVMCAPRSRGS